LTGGLGPTIDDITIKTVATLIGKKLVLNRTILKDINRHFKARGFAAPPGNDRQAYIPEGAKWLANKVGTAPGVIIEYRDKVIICLPGPPRELNPIFEDGVIPYLKKGFKSGWVFSTRAIKITGLPESRVNLMVKDFLKLPPPTTIGIYAKLGQVDLAIMAKAKSEAAARREIAKVEKKVRVRLKDHIFGYDDDTLEGAVAAVLSKKKKTIAVAESCTGGLISSRLTDVSGSSKYFIRGAVPYANDVKVKYVGVSKDSLKKYGAVSRQVAVEMARGIRSIMGVDIGLGVTGIAGPTGGTKKKPVGLVYIALVTDTKRLVKECTFKGSRLDIKSQASQAALDMIRTNA
jgi:nicotinamide-nucleotide amidase